MNSLLYIFVILGSSLTGIVGRTAITGGKIVTYFDYLRYPVLILVDQNAPSCGGSIIQSTSILTAAHCVIGYDNRLLGKSISILAGTVQISEVGSVIRVQIVYVPQEYQPLDPNLNGDIAVLILHNQLDLKQGKDLFVKLSLPKADLFYNNRTVTIAGFGWDVMDHQNHLIGFNSDDKLRIADAKVLGYEECEQQHPSMQISNDKHLCARVEQPPYSHGPHGTCVGDDGGSLVLRGKHVIGVLTKSTNECSERQNSSIYTNTKYYRNFITRAAGNKFKLSLMRMYPV